MSEYLPRAQLEIGARYRCEARNFTEGVWTGDVFVYTRHKFGKSFIDCELYWDDDEHYGTVKPLEKIEETV